MLTSVTFQGWLTCTQLRGMCALVLSVSHYTHAPYVYLRVPHAELQVARMQNIAAGLEALAARCTSLQVLDLYLSKGAFSLPVHFHICTREPSFKSQRYDY